MTRHLVTRVLILLVAGFMKVCSDPNISTSTPTPCYGDVVTLVCHHPEVASNPEGYSTNGPVWRENGVAIRPTTGIYLQTDTSEDLMNTTLTISITGDHFRNKSFNYSCQLQIAENGIPTSEVKTSPEVTVDPVEPQPISDIRNITSHETSIAFNLAHNPMKCYKNRISYYLSWRNMDKNTENGYYVPGEQTYIATGLDVNGNYTVSVRTVVDGNLRSTAVTKNVTTGSPNVPLNITFARGVHSINVSWEHTDFCFENLQFSVTWKDPNGHYDESPPVTAKTFNILDLNPDTNYIICIRAVSTSDEQVKSKEKCLYPKTLANSTKEPHNLTLAAGVTSINASWEQDNSLFEDYTFEFSVTWQEVDAANIVGIVVNRTTFNIQGLKPGTNYSICVTAIINSDEQVRSEKTCRPIKTFELSGKNAAAIAGPVVGVVTITVVAVIACML